MGAESGLIGLEDVGADDPPLALGDVSMRVGSEPIRQRIAARHLWVEDVGIAGSDDCVEDVPNGVLIRCSGEA